VHAIGAEATELIHIGQTVMAYNGTVDFFINNAFNVPTLSECYKVAAVNANNKLRARVGSSTEHIEKKIIELKTANA
jgi:NAD(P) transhydrogenase